MIDTLSTGEGFRLRAIRLLALSDAPDAFATTLEEAKRWNPERWEIQIQKHPTFVSREDAADIGMVRGAHNDDDPATAYLISMWVAPEARGRGIGSALVGEVIRWARELGYARLVLDVGEENVPARRLYSSCGFTETGGTGTLPPPREDVRELEMELILKVS